jgi:hypothetical protein
MHREYRRVRPQRARQARLDRDRSNAIIRELKRIRYEAERPDDPPVPLEVIELEREADEADRAWQLNFRNRAGQHSDQARAARKVREKLADRTRENIAGAAGFTGANPTAFWGQLDQIRRNRELDGQLLQIEEEHRQAAEAIRVVSDPAPYDEGSPHSFIRDWLSASDPTFATGIATRSHSESDMSAEAVAERLRRHDKDVREQVNRRTEYGRRIEAIIGESCRKEDRRQHKREAKAEIRAFGTGGGATASAGGGQGAAFVSPAILLDQVWAPYRSPYAAFRDQLDKSTPLPDWGMTVYVATFASGGTSVTSQTEGSTVSETDPVSTYQSGAVTLKAGQVSVTYQFLDRAGPGIAGDQVLYEQIRNQLDAEVDKYAIGQALSGAQEVTNSGSFEVAKASGVGGLLGDLKKAKNKVRDAAGVRTPATHCFAIGDLCDHIAAYADAQGRPIFTPDLDDNRLPIRAGGDPEGEGYTGYVLTGLALFGDDNIPKVGTTEQTQLIVTRPNRILQIEAAPVPYCFPPTVAGSLEAVLGVRQYVATIPRWKEAVAVVNGKAYEATTFA